MRAGQAGALCPFLLSLHSSPEDHREGNSDPALILLKPEGDRNEQGWNHLLPDSWSFIRWAPCSGEIRKDEQIRKENKKGPGGWGGPGAHRDLLAAPQSQQGQLCPEDGPSHPSPAEDRGEGAQGGIPLHPEPSAHPLRMRRSCGSPAAGAGI